MKAADVSSLSTLGEANALCERLGCGLGIVIDVYHVWWDPMLASELSRASGRIVGFHLCDWLAPLDRNMTGRGMMGDGIIDIPSIRVQVEEACYHGFHEVELPSKVWAERDPAEVVRTCIERYGSRQRGVGRYAEIV
jgi:sugar phosphate isomerase/epimerase